MIAQDYFNMIDNAYDSGNLKNIEDGIKDTIAVCLKEYGENSALYASMLSELGGFYRGQRRYDESLEYYSKAKDILARTSGDQSVDYATAVNNMASTYRLMGLYDQAMESFKTCLGIYEKTVGKKHLLYASGINNLALISLDKGDIAEAARLFSESGKILESIPSARDEYATSLVNTGVLFFKAANYDDAKTKLSVAIEMYENELGTWSPHYHSALNTLGQVYEKKGDYENAAECFLKSMDAAAAIYDKSHPEYKAAERNYNSIKDKLTANKAI